MTDLIKRIEGRVGRLTLNRPKALNAVTHDMLQGIESAMIEWRDDPKVDMILIDAEGEKAFCAGGDIVAIYNDGIKGDDTRALQFWRDEYRLNAAIPNYPKPYVAIMDGFVMGGGVGISAHGSHRIVTERTKFAMPECAIGLIPDVGGSHLLGKMPGHTGEYAALTGARLSGADCVWSGLADYFVPSDQLTDLKQALVESGDPETIRTFATDAALGSLATDQKVIDAIFGEPQLADVILKLKGSVEPFAEKTLAQMEKGAPLSLLAIFHLIRKGRGGTLEQALRDEFRFVCWSISDGEFIEGIRAMVIDKDHSPNWKYKELADVWPALIKSMDEPAKVGDFEV